MSNRIKSADIGDLVFFEQLLENDEINPYLGDKHLQEDDGELADDTSQFDTKTIENTENHGNSETLADQPFDEEPQEAISEGGQYAVQTSITDVENLVSYPIFKNDLPCSETELPSHPGT